MTRKKKKGIFCKKCGTEIDVKENPPSKTWTMTSPMPDKEGRITITIMGSFRCPQCGKAIRGVLKKIKGDDMGSTISKKQLLLNAVGGIEEPTKITEISVEGISSPVAVEKAIIALIKAGELPGRIEDGVYFPD